MSHPLTINEGFIAMPEWPRKLKCECDGTEFFVLVDKSPKTGVRPVKFVCVDETCGIEHDMTPPERLNQ